MRTNKDNSGFLVLGIAPGIPALIFGLIGILFSVLGGVFSAAPDKVNITVNGKLLEGAEAVEYASKLGNIFSVVGGIGLVLAAVMIGICVTMLLVYLHKNLVQQN